MTRTTYRKPYISIRKAAQAFRSTPFEFDLFDVGHKISSYETEQTRLAYEFVRLFIVNVVSILLWEGLAFSTDR